MILQRGGGKYGQGIGAVVIMGCFVIAMLYLFGVLM
jgi:hypothetical protein